MRCSVWEMVWSICPARPLTWTAWAWSSPLPTLRRSLLAIAAVPPGSGADGPARTAGPERHRLQVFAVASDIPRTTTCG